MFWAKLILSLQINYIPTQDDLHTLCDEDEAMYVGSSNNLGQRTGAHVREEYSGIPELSIILEQRIWHTQKINCWIYVNIHTTYKKQVTTQQIQAMYTLSVEGGIKL